MYVHRAHYVLADLCIRCTEQTETSFFRLEAAVHYIKTLSVTFFFLSGSLGPPASASIWHLTVLHSDCFVDVSPRQLS